MHSKTKKSKRKNRKLVSMENDHCIPVPNYLKIKDIIIDGMQNISDVLNYHFVNVGKMAEKSQFNTQNFISL